MPENQLHLYRRQVEQLIKQVEQVERNIPSLSDDEILDLFEAITDLQDYNSQLMGAIDDLQDALGEAIDEMEEAA